MQIEQINIGGFGTLSNCRMDLRQPGVTVIYGVNGAGKTTLLQFIRGILGGFEEARQRRLLPPLKEGIPGGSLTLRNSQGCFEVIRRFRPDHSDTLAVNLLNGSAADVTHLRDELRSLSPQLLQTLFAGGFDPRSLENLVGLALQSGIELAPRKTAGAWITGRIRTMENQRGDLFRGPPPQGRLAELEERRQQIEAQLAAHRRQQQERLALFQQTQRRVLDKIERLQQEAGWLSQELQACEADLTEVQTRLWSTRPTTVQEVTRCERPVPSADWTRQIQEIDQAVANAQQVLRDLAGSRMSLSISRAEFAGLEECDPAARFREQRQTLGALEAHTRQLGELVHSLGAASQCICGSQSEAMSTVITRAQEQIWLLCQSLSRQQIAHEQQLLHSQREGVDRCELELTRQIQRLRLRREELLRSPQRTPADRVHANGALESRYCECVGHLDAAAAHSPQPEESHVQPQIVVHEKTVMVSAARPGDDEQARLLAERRSQLRRQWLAACLRLRGAQLELDQLNPHEDDPLRGGGARALRAEYAEIEQQLADGREQWQSLALLQSILQRTQQKMNVEVPAAVIEEASGYLARMTEGRYPGFRFVVSGAELRIRSATGAEMPASALSRGTLEQAILSFRLALCAEFSRRGSSTPLILDDVLADSDGQRLQAAVDVLVEFSKTHQILFLTCQKHLLALFASRQAAIQALPGSPLPNFSGAEESQVILDEFAPEQQHWDRVQPDDPFWLQPQSPLQFLPSLSEQMSRRLGALGIRNVKELIELDPEVTEIPLESLQISSMGLRLWQAEGKLLCCVPHLTGRDAQLLVACDIHSPAELAECSLVDLLQRVRRLRLQEQAEFAFPWLKEHPEWPTTEVADRWIRHAQAARTWHQAREQESTRPHSARRRLQRPPRRSSRETANPAIAGSLPLPVETGTAAEHAQWRFYLQHDSPVVDAPSIGSRTAERLNGIGIVQVAHLLKAQAEDIAGQLNREDVTEEIVTAWQWQAALMCRIPQLRGHDAQVLTSCGIFDPETLAAMQPDVLYRRVKPFVKSKAGQRLLRSAKVPDLAEVTDWINWARNSQLARAA